MTAPGLIADFRKWAATVPAYGELVVVDPGGTCGLLTVSRHVAGPDSYAVGKCSLDELPQALRTRCGPLGVRAIICEDFSLNPKRRNDPKMPASQGIGVARAVAHSAGLPLFLLQPNVKTEGHRRLDAAGLAAYAACRSDHERDVVDLAGKALFELRKAQR